MARYAMIVGLLPAALAGALGSAPAGEGPVEVTEALRRIEQRLTEIEKRVDLLARTGPRPAKAPLKDSDVGVQELVDKAEDGTTVKIPRARYTSEKGIVLRNRKDLVLEFEPGAAVLVTDLTENVLTLEGCTNVTVTGALMRHKKPALEYQCHGSVVMIRKCEKVHVVECDLNGCGAVGLNIRGSRELTVRKCRLHKNTFCALYVESSGKLQILDNIIEDNGMLIQTFRVDDLVMSNNLIRGNKGYFGIGTRTEPGPSTLEEAE